MKGSVSVQQQRLNTALPSSNTSALPIFAALQQAKQQLAGTPDELSPLAWRAYTANAGVPGLDVPANVGGQGLSAREMADIFAFCGKINLDLRDVPGGGHSRLLLHAASHRFDHVLRNVAAGKEFTAIAITEEEAGSDMHAISTTAIPLPDGSYRISGRKRYVARLEQATQIIVFVQVKRSDCSPLLTAFLLPRDFPGIMIEHLKTTGLHGVSFGGLCFHNIEVPASLRIGGEGQGFWLFNKHFTYWRIAMAAAAVGCARGAIDQAMDRLHPFILKGPILL